MHNFIWYIFRSILACSSVLLMMTAIWSYFQNQTVARALSHPKIMVGDSHVEDLTWRNAPRISSPGNALLTQYLCLKRFGQVPENLRPKSTVFVLSAHPGIFTKSQENRLNVFDSDWTIKKTGQIASLFRLSDMSDSNINWKLRCRLLFGITQFVPLPVNWNGVCYPGTNTQGFRPGSELKARFSDQSFMHEIPNSLLLFNEINRLAGLYNCEIVWVDNPSHPELRGVYADNAKLKYKRLLLRASTKQHVHYLDLSEISNEDLGFRDGDHIYCELSKAVEIELNHLLMEIDEQFLLIPHALQLP